MYHADEAAARELVKLACKDAPNPDDVNILADTGWFQEEATTVPTKDQLLALQNKVGGATALDVPEYWTQVTDPTLAERIPLNINSSEAAAVITSFTTTLRPPRYNRVTVRAAFFDVDHVHSPCSPLLTLTSIRSQVWKGSKIWPCGKVTW